jgi:micrococcal nuclease
MKKLTFFLIPLLFACNSKPAPDKLKSSTQSLHSVGTTASATGGKVVKVADGDTFTYLNYDKQQEKIRLHGIDAPEKAQDFGTVARKRLDELVFGKSVRIERKDTDRYGRTIALVYTEEGICVNEQLLKDGLVWHYKRYDDNPAWAALEEEAKSSKVGLWAHSDPTPPWDFRKTKR